MFILVMNHLKKMRIFERFRDGGVKFQAVSFVYAFYTYMESNVNWPIVHPSRSLNDTLVQF